MKLSSDFRFDRNFRLRSQRFSSSTNSSSYQTASLHATALPDRRDRFHTVTLASTIALCLLSSQFVWAQEFPLPSQVWNIKSDEGSAQTKQDGKNDDPDIGSPNAANQSKQQAGEEVTYDLSPIDASKDLIRDPVQVRRMASKEKSEAIEFEIDVRLTYHNPSNSQVRLLHQADGKSARFYAAFTDPEKHLPQLGALMRVRGRTGRKRAGHVIIDSWKQIGDAIPPTAFSIPSTVAASKDQNYQGQYCAIRGVLSEVLIRHANYELVIKNQGGLHFWCIRIEDKSKEFFTQSIGKRIRVTGVMVGEQNEKGERSGARLRAMETRQFQFSQVDKPEQDFDRIEGTVIAKDMRNWLGITDGQTVHWVYSDVSNDVPLFSRVIVMCRNGNRATPESTRLSKILLAVGPDDELAAKELIVRDLQALEFAAQPVTTMATVESVHGHADAYEVRMKMGTVPFIARINRPTDKDFRKRLSEGNIVQLTGVRRAFPATHKGLAAFRLVVNDPSSLTLVSKPIHLYAKQVGLIALCVLSLLGVVLAWNYSLRSTVRAKTKSIREIANRLQASCDATLDGMMFFDRDDRLVQATGCALDLLDAGSSAQLSADIAGRHLATHMKETSTFWGEWQKALRDRKNGVRSEHTLESEANILALHSAPIINSDGEYDGRICTLRDVTEQRKIEQDLAQSQKQIAIGRLAGGIAHDFNNLLMAISANLTLVQRNDDDNAKVQHHTAIAQVAVDRASELTRQLLDFSRRGELSVDVVHVNDCVTKVGELAKHMLGNDVELCLQMSPDLALTKIDAPQIEHVLLNLCINARDSIESTHGHINVATSNQVHPTLGPCVRISVEDDGRGMDKETAAMAFEPFFTTKEVGQGTGLGLAIAYGIVKQHGGIIQCESKLGRGTRFEIFLPQTTELRAESSSSTSSTLGRTSMNTETMRVLLVDDEPMIRDAGTALLAALGHESVCAADGQTALNLLDRDSDFDVVLLDLTMPFMSGGETLKRIKSKFPQLCVIICSGYSVDIGSLGDDPLAAPEAVLSKPFSIEDIRRVLEVSKTQRV